MSVSLLLMVGGLFALVLGGECLVRGASTIAARLRIPPLIIGLTVVAFGTSAPELGVSLQAALRGSTDVAVGNVVGSNIFNVLLILGVSALITPLVVSSQLIRFDVPLMIGVSVLTWALACDGLMGRIDGAILFAIVVVYTVMSIRMARRESATVKEEFDAEYALPSEAFESPASSWLVPGLQILGGLVCLGLGSDWLVRGAVSIASDLGVSELIIGITIVAAGTSLPEVVTSIVASVRGERDIAVGNVVGSNIFNLSCVLGLSAMVGPQGVSVASNVLQFDLPVMIAVAIICLPIFFTGGRITRWEGLVFLTFYLSYTASLVMIATGSVSVRQLSWSVLYVVLPLTVLTLVLSQTSCCRRSSSIPTS